ncbi:MAG: ROK family transcriptional regulator [Clostridia bacterium]|nr:ROK family transcriptional regulator [Clostridia bacterium]
MKKKIGSFSLMKRMNIALILNLIREKGIVSRIDIAKETGLTAATVTNLTAELIDNNLVEEFSTGLSTGGRKPILLKINSSEFCIASASVTTDKVEFAVYDFCAKIIFYKHKSIEKSASPMECIDFILKSFDEFKKSNSTRVIGMGVGIHGVVDSEAGVSVYAPNLNWHNVNIKELIEEKISIPVMVANDVRLMAMAEMWFGNSKNADDFAFLYVGKGVGGAIVIDKKLFRGANDAAGEIGHSVIDPEGPLCECGKKGCLQAFTSEDAMLKNMKANLSKTKHLNENSTCHDIIDAYLNYSDEAAVLTVEKEIKYLSIGISNIINIFNPSLIVLSSDIKDFDIAVMNRISGEIKKSFGGVFMQNTNLCYSSLGTRVLLNGATALVLSRVYENPGMLWDNKEE